MASLKALWKWKLLSILAKGGGWVFGPSRSENRISLVKAGKAAIGTNTCSLIEQLLWEREGQEVFRKRKKTTAINETFNELLPLLSLSLKPVKISFCIRDPFETFLLMNAKLSAWNRVISNNTYYFFARALFRLRCSASDGSNQGWQLVGIVVCATTRNIFHNTHRI